MSISEFKRKLGERIMILRKQNNLSQEQLAHTIGKDKQFINRYEVQGANPTAFILFQIAKALKVTPNELLTFESMSK